MSDTLPAHYFYFFWLVEPGLTLCGAAYAMFRPGAYAADLLPEEVERFTAVLGNTIRGKMVVGGLGSCFFLLALISLSLFPLFKWQLAQAIDIQEKLVRGLLVPLAVADITHVVWTILPLPSDLVVAPFRWTQLIHGNVAITTMLLAVRICWFMGLGRLTASAEFDGSASRAIPTKKRTRARKTEKNE